jgi:hypothetical protein
MGNLISQNIMYSLDDVNDIEISAVGDGTFELRAGDDIRTFRNKQDLKTYCLNVQSAYEKTLRFSEDLAKAKTPPETVRVIHEGLARLAGAK